MSARRGAPWSWRKRRSQFGRSPMIDVAALATTVVSTYLFPYLAKGAGKFAEEVVSKAGEAAGKQATGIAEKIWALVKSAFSSDDETRDLENFQKYPDESRKLIERKLQERLAKDEKLARELDTLTRTEGPK